MPFARVSCRAQHGLAAPLVQVEVSLAAGLPMFSIVGLARMVVREAKERVRAALLNAQFEFPAGRITVNLSPADLPKEGGRFDLPIALGILLASRQVRGAPARAAAACEFYGELGLTGELRAVPGLLPAAIAAWHAGHELIVPRANAPETCAAAPGRVRSAAHLLEVCAHVAGTRLLAADRPPQVAGAAPTGMRLDLADVHGQVLAKRALTIAAAGGHSLLLIGPPGCGKSMLAQRLPGLLPPLAPAEALEVAAIASVSAAGFDGGPCTERPFRAPHHSTTVPALVGGGARARPGEVSLAHRGVLFLDELPQFGRRVLDTLREPLETGVVCVARAALQTQYPAQFQLVAAMNPCSCGNLGDPAGACGCTPAMVRHYRARLSGPLLDRLDLHVELARLTPEEFEETRGEDAGTAATARRVHQARELQLARQGVCNARLADRELERACAPDVAGRRLLEAAMRGHRLSARARARVLKVARTIADLDGHPRVGVRQVSEAVMLRCLDRAAPDA